MKNIPLILAALVFVSPAFAQIPAPASSPKPSPTPACQAPEFRQFDFWLGKWTVKNPQGQQVGTSEISRQAEGCAIREQWTAASGKAGMSINYYDESNRQWHQDWVGGDGTILHLHGGLKDGVMVISDEPKSGQSALINRISYTPMPDEQSETGMVDLEGQRPDLADHLPRYLREAAVGHRFDRRFRKFRS